MVEAAYNKVGSRPGHHGTLIGNWQEERDLRDFTGEGRYVNTYQSFEASFKRVANLDSYLRI